MNIAYKKVSAFVFSAMVTASVVGMENENIVEIATEQVAPCAWYKKGSVQAAAVAVTLATVGCAYAVRRGKVAVPAFIAALIVASQTIQDTTPKSDVANNNPEQTIDVQDQVVAGQTSGAVESTKSLNDLVNGMIGLIKNIQIPTLDQYKSALESITEEDFKPMNEDLVR